MSQYTNFKFITEGHIFMHCKILRIKYDSISLESHTFCLTKFRLSSSSDDCVFETVIHLKFSMSIKTNSLRMRYLPSYYNNFILFSLLIWISFQRVSYYGYRIIFYNFKSLKKQAVYFRIYNWTPFTSHFILFHSLQSYNGTFLMNNLVPL